MQISFNTGSVHSMAGRRSSHRLPLLLAMWGCLTGLAWAGVTVGELRCEYAVNPLGIDTLQPRLSWKLSATARAQLQSAYQVQVTASPQDQTVLWDSGKVASDQNTHVVYAGAPLRPGERYYWKVRVWSALSGVEGAQQGQVSPWSDTAFWQIGLLAASDWKARWIGPASSSVPSWDDFTVAADITLQTNAVGILFRASDSQNLYMWQLNTAVGPALTLRPQICKNGQWTFLAPVPLRKVVAQADENKPHHVEIEARGPRIRTRIDGQLVDERVDATFAAGTIGFRTSSGEHALVDNLTLTDASGHVLLKDDFNGKSSVVFPDAHLKQGQLELAEALLLHRQSLAKDCPRLRKNFTLSRPVRRATVSVCGLGFYELYLNGAKVGQRELAPANTDYGRRLLFDTLDVTAAVKQGDNAIGLWLAPGYSDDYSKYGWKWEHDKRAILQLDVVFDDGTTTTVVTDESWRTAASPLIFASLYDGETFDAGLETPGWATAAFADGGWKPVRLLDAPAAKLVSNWMPPVRVIETIRPVSVTEPRPGVFIFDMGQDFAGWVRLRATGARGTRIVLHHSELLGADGLLDMWTNRRAKATDTFVLRGEGVEMYQPRFTYHGFRFVEVTGYPGRPTLDDITGCVVHADIQPEGTCVTSDAMLNRVHSNCVWGMRSNLMSIPTDCPMRDERTPCQMDSLAYEDAAMCNFWMHGFYMKWLGDIVGGRGNPDWNGDQVLLPWRLYQHYGDRRVLETNYANMRAYVDALHAKTPGHVYTDGFGDWCPPNAGTWETFHGSVTEVNTGYYAELARIVSETATLLGKTDEAAHYAGLAHDIAHASFEQRFDAKTASYGDGRQTSNLMPLALDLVPKAQRAAVFSRLVATIQGKDQGRLDTGIMGTRYLVDVLCDGGQADLAIGMLTQTNFPGFGYQISHGATTTWEQWTVKGGMNSHNHAMFAGVDASFFTRLAGITAAQPGYAQISIRPCLPSSLTFVDATQETIRGRVRSRWQRDGNTVTMLISVPVNTTATVYVPALDRQSVTEGGQSLDKAEGVTFVGMEGAYAVLRVGSGDYRFTGTTAKP